MDRVRLRKLESIVTPILERDPETRCDDRKLYLAVLRWAGIDVSVSLSTYLNESEYFPSYEGITRVRRKIQSKRPELQKGSWKPMETAEYSAYALER